MYPYVWSQCPLVEDDHEDSQLPAGIHAMAGSRKQQCTNIHIGSGSTQSRLNDHITSHRTNPLHILAVMLERWSKGCGARPGYPVSTKEACRGSARRKVGR
ncbi:uncharacterized protein STEHIDRAFT_129789 [Stereum hirsutum FP-91666 SS1]|uniref:uncharacterized protein n=1 Tax=Stereum hirsutum (strain FP-91666) TaxID=721885 RepID=UPI000440C608|nr:uncharacterized protein STEHIDRAFT_129789 [Stereum hirsutum FP-91666 SS1]EIM89366.1 hypothetical protein STEHIDRAFT_129789 [Stereum hirsutum FP-91666 SS1]